MWHNAQDAYLESRVLSADPIELVRLLYRAAMEAVRTARRHLANNEILERARAISRASEIVLELTASLDYQQGGEIASQLAALYEYILRQLTEANLQQSDANLAEVLNLLATLSEAWEGISLEEPPRREGDFFGEPLPQEATSSPVHAWSF